MAPRARELSQHATNRNENDRLRVVLACGADFSGGIFGGTESLVQDFASSPATSARTSIVIAGLAANGELPGVLYRRKFGTCDHAFVPVAHGARDRRLPLRVAFAAGLWKYRRVLRQFVPHVLYAHTAESAIALGIACPGVPMVMHVHGVDNPLALSRFTVARSWPVPLIYDRTVFRPAVRSAHGLLANLDDQQFGEFSRRYARHLRVSTRQVRAGVDVSLFRPSEQPSARAALGLPLGDVILIFSGRLEPPKGVDSVIKATRLLGATIPHIRLLIVGDGSAREHLVKQAKDNGIGERTTFTGTVARDRIPLYLSAADVFVTGTHRESISMALLEALACGVPAVCGPVGGAREVLGEPMTGVVIAKVTPDALAEGVLAVLRMGGAARAACVARARRYSADESNRSIIETLESVGATPSETERAMS